MVELREGSALLHLMNSSSRPGREARRSDPNADPAANEPPAASRQPPAGERSEPTITCGFCGQEFVEDPTQATCQACPLKKSCGLMRCPHCGYENAREPGWISRIKEWIG